MNQRDIERQRLFSKDAGRYGVDGEGCLRFAFCEVDRGIGCCVDDQIGKDALDLTTNLIGLCHVELIATQHDQLAERAQPVLQLT
ncbi:hypothetical protein D3C71_886880 [compost metagenome]